MDFRTKDVLTASSLSSGLTIGFIADHITLANTALGLTAVGLNMGMFLFVQRMTGWRARHAAALLLNNVCPNCLMPNELAEVTSQDGQPVDEDGRTGFCGRCKMSFIVKEDEFGLKARRLGKVQW